jgi:hypothetical protein
MMSPDAFLHGAVPIPVEPAANLPAKPPHRPSSYNEDKAFTLCERLGNGEKLHAICADPDMPSPATVYRWIASIAEFRLAYQCALYAKFDAKSEELIQIADDASQDNTAEAGDDGVPILKPNKESIERTRVRLDIRKWLMAKELPRKYADMAALPAPPAESPGASGAGAGEGAKVIEATAAPAEEHPLCTAIQAWRASKEKA